MNFNKKNIVTIIILGGLLIPFILITDIFPFLRFGMFAEPIQQERQTEKFLIYQTDSFNHTRIFTPSSIGINPNTFYYLCRNYLYRNENELFAQKLFASTDPSIKTFEFLHIVKKHNLDKADTLSIGKYKRNE